MASNDRVGNVYLDVLPRGTTFNSGVQAIINKAEKDAKFNVGANTAQAEQQVKKLSDQITNDVGGSWVTAATQAAAFTGAVFAVRAAVEGVVNKFSELFDGIAKARAGFTALLGEKSGNSLLAQVRQFAIDSPFVTSELVSYSQQLLGVGKAANTIVPTLKNVGDIVASVGGDTSQLGSILYALTQIQTIGKLTGQDARQLQNQLVPITRYIADYTGKAVADVKKLEEAGGISSDLVFAAIQNQGKKVEGALNNSVRTISGAKSVLSDTVRNFFQSSTGLNKIYDDLVKGIQKLAAEVAKPEIQTKIEGFLDSFGKLYEALKPVLKGLSDLAGSGGLTTLSTFTTILDSLATVINAIPEPVLKLIGTTFGVLGALKAPLALIQYATNIQRITSGLLGQAVASKTAAIATEQVAVAETAATIAARESAVAYEQMSLQLGEVSTQAVVAAERISLLARAKAGLTNDQGGFTRGGSGAVLGASVAAGLAGSLLQSNTSSSNVPTQTAGGALTYGALGAQLGATFGPEGAAIGAIGGAALGAITSFLSSSEEKLRKEVQKYKDIGKATADAYLQEQQKAFANSDPTAIQGGVDKLAALQLQLDQLNRSKFQNPNINTESDPTFQLQKAADAREKFNSENAKSKAELQGQIAELQPQIDQLTQPILDTVELLRKNGQGQSFFQQIIGQPVEGRAIKSITDLDAEFRQYGLTIADVAAKGPAAVLEIITNINGLDTAQKKAVVSANELADAIKTAQADSQAIYATQISNITAQTNAISALDKAKKSGASVLTPGTEADQQTSVLTAQGDLLKAQDAARSLAYANSVVATNAAILRAKKEGNSALITELELNKDKVATDAAVAAEQKVANDVLESNTKAVYANITARYLALQVAARQKISTDLELAQTSVSTLQAAKAAQLTGLTKSADPLAQIAASKTLLDAQDAAANEAANKASARDRAALALLADKTSVKAIEIQSSITSEETIAKEAARQKVLNDVIQDGVVSLQYYNQAQEIANDQRQKAIQLTELQNRSSAIGGLTSATAARVTAIQRPDDAALQVASRLATAQAVQASGDAAAFLATEKLVAARDELIKGGFTEANQNVKSLNAQIAYADQVARTAAETSALAQIERDASIARLNYNVQTITFLENLQKAQIAAAAVFGDEIAKDQALSGFAGAIDSAAQSAIAFATAASSKIVKGDIFSGVIDQSTQAALVLSAATAKQSQFTAALAYGASTAQAAAIGLSAYNAVLEGALVNFDDITKKVLGLNSVLATTDGTGQAAVVTATSKAIAQTEAALAAAQQQVAALTPAGGRNSDDTAGNSDATAKLAAAVAESARQQHILDILAGKAKDDLGILSSISVGAQAIIQPQLDQAAAQKAKEAADNLQQWQDKIVNATNALTDRLQAAADNIASAADKWVGSIKERTQYEAAVSVSRLTRNATQQGADISEITSGLANLRSRGVSDAVLKALGIDSIADVRQVRKLVKSSDSDLAKLTGAVSARGAQALTLATSEEQAQQRQTITSAILDAAKTLGVESNFTKAQATALANSIDINVNMDPAAIAAAFIATLSGAKIG